MNKETDLQKLGKNIAKYRYLKGFSQDGLAFEAGIGERTVSRIESGDSDPRFTTLKKIAETLDVKIKDLLEFDR